MNPEIPTTLTEKSPIKEGVRFVFEQHPKLAEIGTKEEYSKYLDQIFPESTIKNILYHAGPNKNIKNFNDPSSSGLSNIWFSEKPITSGQFGENTYCVVLNLKNPLNEFDKSINYRKELKTYETPINPEWKNNYPTTGELPIYKHDGTIRSPSISDGGNKNITVRTPEQIHILGSEEDLEKFRNFKENKDKKQQ